MYMAKRSFLAITECNEGCGAFGATSLIITLGVYQI